MNDKVIKAAVVLTGIVWVKVYGKYQYYRGRVDANNVNRIFIDIQKSVIDVLNEKLDKYERGEA